MSQNTAGLSDYLYDDNGNMTGKEQGETFWSYSYDYENRLTKVKQGSDSTVFYYNGDGVRLKKVCTGDTSTQYIPDGMYSAVERTNGGRLRYKYVYANGMLLARLDSLGRKYYYHHDALGSTVGISDSNYAVYKSYLYDEFGDSLGCWGSTPYNTYRYTGQEYDGKPAYAYNLRARVYYPKLGRFMQNDPIGDNGGSLNWYLYVANNPMNWTDPTGKKVYYCRRGIHVYIAIDGSKVHGSWGFYPVNDPYAGIASGILNGWVPGYIKMYETGGKCDPVTIDDCHDQKAYDAIYTLFRAQPYYHLLYFNCRDWAKTVLRMSGID